jgi:hypothetical protein
MTIWYKGVIEKLRNGFLDIHFDPTTRSYAYAVIDYCLPYPWPGAGILFSEQRHGRPENRAPNLLL